MPVGELGDVCDDGAGGVGNERTVCWKALGDFLKGLSARQRGLINMNDRLLVGYPPLWPERPTFQTSQCQYLVP
jgi:hypothetical protein